MINAWQHSENAGREVRGKWKIVPVRQTKHNAPEKKLGYAEEERQSLMEQKIATVMQRRNILNERSKTEEDKIKI